MIQVPFPETPPRCAETRPGALHFPGLLPALLLAAAFATPALAAEQAPERLLYSEGGMLVLVPPVFPNEALAKGLAGKVDVFGTVRTDGRLDNVRIEATPAIEPFESAVMDVEPLWRLQPRIVSPGCGADETRGHVTIWFEIQGGKPKVSYATGSPARPDPPEIHRDRKPVHLVAPLYPKVVAESPNAPKSILQLAYVGVADDGAVTNITVAPMLYYREFEPLLVAALRQWKYAPQAHSWCGEVEFRMSLD